MVRKEVIFQGYEKLSPNLGISHFPMNYADTFWTSPNFDELIAKEQKYQLISWHINKDLLFLSFYPSM